MITSVRLTLFALSSLLFFSCGEREGGEGGRTDTTPPSATATPSAEEKETSIDSSLSADSSSIELVPQQIHLSHTNHLLKEKEFTLNVAKGFRIAVAADGLRRLRFMAFSPDQRLFVTDMYDLADNRAGKVYVLEDFDPATKRFGKQTTYLENLRNPNNLAFYTDKKGQAWLYIALTDRLVRYRYQPGSGKPTGQPETLATFPDYGNGYREGGWHLTRTVAFGGNGKLYVSVGSSCNACQEKEEVRASVLEMNPDGTAQRIYARGLRNVVGMRWLRDTLCVTDMGADHLGLDKPEDSFYLLKEGANYGWPYTYEYQRKVYADPVYGGLPGAISPEHVPLSWVGFPAHSASLGFDWFGGATDPELKNYFLVALHGSGSVAMKRGYSIVRVADGKLAGNFINGFLKGTERYGRPCDILHDGPNSFFFTDDHGGVLYYVYKES